MRPSPLKKGKVQPHHTVLAFRGAPLTAYFSPRQQVCPTSAGQRPKSTQPDTDIFSK